MKKFIRKFKNSINKRYNKFGKVVFKKALKYPKLSKFYYCFFNDLFDNEHKLMLQAQNAFYNDKKSKARSCFFNRNIHRIEKALAMPNKRSCFAGDYILETVEAFIDLLNNEYDYSQIKWGKDVLDSYFLAVEHTPSIKTAFELYKTIKLDYKADSEKLLPIKYSEIKKSGVSLEQFEILCRQRYSVRWYKNNIVEKEKVIQAVEIALTAPSACNRQAFRFEYIDDPDFIKLFCKLPSGTSIFADNITSMMFVIGDASAYGDSGGLHQLYLDVGLMSMTFMNALELQGVSSCPLHWPGIAEPEEKLIKLLNLKPYEKCALAFSIGYPLEDGKVMNSQRRSIDKVWSYNNVHTT